MNRRTWHSGFSAFAALATALCASGGCGDGAAPGKRGDSGTGGAAVEVDAGKDDVALGYEAGEDGGGGEARWDGPRDDGGAGGGTGSPGTGGVAGMDGGADIARTGGAGGTGGLPPTDAGVGGNIQRFVYGCGVAADGGVLDSADTAAPVDASVPAAGVPCSEPGALACNGPNQQQTLICRSGAWTMRATCAADERCDRDTGVCTRVVPECIGRTPGDGFCDGEVYRQCGPDLVTLTSTPCCGKCAPGGCLPPSCGDGKLEVPEECDDGNPMPADGCERDCTASAIVQLAAGWSQSCALLKGGLVRCWGGNDHGQLGLGTTENLSTRRPFELGPIHLDGDAVSLAAGYNHTCALMADRSVQCWGANRRGQLGLGHSKDIGDDEHPTAAVAKVPLGKAVKQIAAGGDTTCALLADDTVRCWGRNDFGQLGLGHARDIGDDETPTAAQAGVSLGARPVALAVAQDHACALLATNQVRCWGRNDKAQLGIGSTNNIGDDELPTAGRTVGFPDNGPLVAITAGGFHTCVREESDVLGSISRCWGYNGDGSMCIGWSEADLLRTGDGWPYVRWASAIVDLGAGAEHLCVLLRNRDFRCCGRNDIAQLGLDHLEAQGDNEPPDAFPPIDFGLDAAGRPAFAVLFAAGALHNCALLNTGRVRCWGFNVAGQLGLGFASDPPWGHVGGTPDTIPSKLPSVDVFATSYPRN